MTQARISVLWFPRHRDPVACFLARDKAGIRIPISRAITAMTTSNSISVNPLDWFIAASC
jgi:hypothetical protein